MSASSERLHVTESAVRVGGAQVYVRTLGAGPPVVILHGGPDFNHNYLVPELDGLASDLRLIYYDQRGRGRSSEGVLPEDVGIESEVDDLLQVMRHFDLEKAALLGHSWGSLLALEFAVRHAGRVSHLVLLNTAPASAEDVAWWRAQRDPTHASAMRAISATAEYARGEIAAEAQYHRAHFSATVRRAEDLDSLLARLRTHFTPADVRKARAIESRLYAQTWLAPGYDLLSRLGSLDMPTLVIHGEHDFVPLRCAARIADAVPGAKLLVLDCGHFAYLERPDEVHRAVVQCVVRP